MTGKCGRCKAHRPLHPNGSGWCYGCVSSVGWHANRGLEAPPTPGRWRRVIRFRMRAARNLPLLDGDAGPAANVTHYDRYDARAAAGLCPSCSRKPDGDFICCKVCRKKARERHRRKSMGKKKTG